MKIITGFVSNSSASSFVIAKICLNNKQKEYVTKAKEIAEINGHEYDLDLFLIEVAKVDYLTFECSNISQIYR